MRSIEISLCGDEWMLTAAADRSGHADRSDHADRSGHAGQSWPARVPGCAHLDLMRAGVIPNPDAPGGEAAQEWIGRSAFTWSRSIALSAAMLEHTHIELVFESIDTVAEVRLDGVVILRVANEFHPHRVDIGAVARGADPLRPMILEVMCAGPVSEVERLEKELGSRPVNGDWTPYPFMRKTACQFGWDWGPRTPSSGIVGLVFIHAWSGMRIDSVRPLVRSCTESEATIDLFVDAVCDGDASQYEARIAVESPDGRGFEAFSSFNKKSHWQDAHETSASQSHAANARAGRGQTAQAHCSIEVPRPMRWWPRGYGAQHLHRVSVELSQKSATLARWSGRVGLRSVALDTTPQVDGTRFAVRVNDQLIWCAGANWIPDGLFRSRPELVDVRQRLLQACDANFVMLRVWGGGGYESNGWYETCDELGIMVWQDFAFACATYPEDDPFPLRVEAEARYQVARLASHPSVVLWCGGNENILAWYSWGFRDRLRAGQSWGRRYWLEILPRICAELDPSRPYWPESPWSGSLELDPNDVARGDRHIWDASAKVEGIRSITPRFASEFGHQSPPALRSIACALQMNEDELAAMDAQSGCAAIADRQRATGGDAPQYGIFLSSRFDQAADFASWIAQAQSVQAKALRIAYSWFRANRPRCAGALVWQMNDAWTGHSWSLVDSHGRAKPSWHAVRDGCAPRMLVIHHRDGTLVIDAVNDTPTLWKSRLSLCKWGNHAATAPIVREDFREGFVVEPWGASTVLRIPKEFLPDQTCALFAEAATDLRGEPIASAWWTDAHEKDLREPSGSKFIPAASLEWVNQPISTSARPMRASILVCAASPLLDAIVIPMGDWIKVEPMLISLSPGESRRVEIAWRDERADAVGSSDRRVDLFAAGRRIATVRAVITPQEKG